jgi:hypothetical protein
MRFQAVALQRAVDALGGEEAQLATELQRFQFRLEMCQTQVNCIAESASRASAVTAVVEALDALRGEIAAVDLRKLEADDSEKQLARATLADLELRVALTCALAHPLPLPVLEEQWRLAAGAIQTWWAQLFSDLATSNLMNTGNAAAIPPVSNASPKVKAKGLPSATAKVAAPVAPSVPVAPALPRTQAQWLALNLAELHTAAREAGHAFLEMQAGLAHRGMTLHLLHGFVRRLWALKRWHLALPAIALARFLSFPAKGTPRPRSLARFGMGLITARCVVVWVTGLGDAGKEYILMQLYMITMEEAMCCISKGEALAAVLQELQATHDAAWAQLPTLLPRHR